MKRRALWPCGRTMRGFRPTITALAVWLTGLLATVTAEAEPIALGPTARPVTSSRSLAEDKLRRARELETRGDVALALTAYTEAIRIDATLGAAYLGLARLREQLSDPREAELLYTHALMLREVRGRALFGRAQLRRAAGRRQEALLDLEQSIAHEADPVGLQMLAGWYVESENWPAALGVWRRLARMRLEAGDAAGAREAELSAAALSLLSGDADPVRSAPAGAGWARQAIAHIAARGLSVKER